MCVCVCLCVFAYSSVAILAQRSAFLRELTSCRLKHRAMSSREEPLVIRLHRFLWNARESAQWTPGNVYLPDEDAGKGSGEGAGKDAGKGSGVNVGKGIAVAVSGSSGQQSSDENRRRAALEKPISSAFSAFRLFRRALTALQPCLSGRDGPSIAASSSGGDPHAATPAASTSAGIVSLPPDTVADAAPRRSRRRSHAPSPRRSRNPRINVAAGEPQHKRRRVADVAAEQPYVFPTRYSYERAVPKGARRAVTGNQVGASCDSGYEGDDSR